MEEKEGEKEKMVEKKLPISIKEFAKKQTTVIWKTEEGQKQLQQAVQAIKEEDLKVSIAVKWLKDECGWTLSMRRIRDIIDMHIGDNWQGY